MNARYALLVMLGASTVALAQNGGFRPPERPGSFELGTLAFKNRDSVVTLPSSIPIVDGDLPLEAISRVAAHPIGDELERTRSAKDIEIYRSKSPSVVLLIGKDKFGSGSVITSAGDILTNWHVVKGATDIGVIFKPTKEGAAPTQDEIKVGHVIKYDSGADLALVRAAEVPRDRPPIRIGDSSEIAVGADVYAIGHPAGGQNWTYTKGIVSQYKPGFEWTDNEGKHKADVIQTQTPINPGNSGGPLITDTGSLVGVNSFKAPGSEGLNYAVSVDEVRRFLSRALATNSAPVSPTVSRTQCEAREVSRGRNKDNNADVIVYSMCSGKADARYIIPDNKLDGIILEKDRNGDGKVDVMYFDYKRTGKWDLSFWDTEYKGYWTLVGYHPDGYIVPTRFESYETYRNRMASR